MATRAEFLPAIVISGNTPHGFYDDKAKFISDTSRFCVWARLKHGAATVSVELDDLDLFSAFEEAAIEYSAISNIAHAKNTLPEFFGRATGSNVSTSGDHYDDGTVAGIEKGYPIKTTTFLRRYAGQLADEIGSNGSYTAYTGTIPLTKGKQIYDLRTEVTGSSGPITSAQGVKVLNVYHDTPRVGLRYNAGAQYFENEFNMKSMPVNGMFQLFPVWPQLLYSMNFEMSNMIRRSFYSYEIHGEKLWVHPIPTANIIRKIRIEYQVTPFDPLAPDVDDGTTGGVGQFAEAPYGALDYHVLNSFSRNWIRKYAFAASKETLGNKRSKYREIPYVDGNMTLNGDALMTQAQDEKDKLRDELKEWLDELGYKELMATQTEISANVREQQAEAPLGIFIL